MDIDISTATRADAPVIARLAVALTAEITERTGMQRGLEVTGGRKMKAILS